MNAKKIFSLLLALFGEALIIFCFLHFGKNVQTEILTLNIIVSTIIYCLVFVDVIFPWVNLKDKSVFMNQQFQLRPNANSTIFASSPIITISTV